MTHETAGLDPAREAVQDLDTLLEYVKAQRGFDFTGYKRATLERRVEKRIQAVGEDGFDGYARYLQEHDEEFVELFNTILINVTTFFRDPEAWAYLRDEILTRLLEEKPDDEPIRLWSAGCASGEEAFSLAIVFCEAMGDEAFRDRVKIYATDLDEAALSLGRHAVYAQKELEEVSDSLRERYFERVDGSRWQFRADLRRSVIFGKHDLIQDAPISRIDLIAARNTLMYFGPEAQTRVLANFHFALNPHGFLFLGKSEMLLSRSRLFVPVELKRRVFAKVPATSMRARLREMIQSGDGVSPARVGDNADLRGATIESMPLAQIVIDEAGTLALANAQARKLFILSQADIGRPLQDLELSYRPVELRSLIDRVYEQHHPVALRDLEWTLGREPRWFDVHISALHGTDGTLIGTGITFSVVTRFRSLQESAQQSQERLETAFEELQSTSEELETTNEELQSTNEELETINDELRLRTDELNQVNAFLESILGSLRTAVVVLDGDLRVQAWNDHATELWGLRSEEVIGEHFLNLDVGLPVAHVAGVLRASLASGDEGVIELDATNRRGRKIRCLVTCSPLCGPTGEARGVIVQMEERGAAEE